jgi:pimeloyl-ACP methyl ester carboxylesterase
MWPRTGTALVVFVTVYNGRARLNVAVSGSGPLIVCVHGFPELWYSWRHQIAHFARLGFRVAALDVRGYGRSAKPKGIEAYTLRNLTSDVAAVIDDLGPEPAILFGHDWGASIVWHTALLYPAKVRAVAGLSVPYFPRGRAPFIDVARLAYKGRFFYQLYFQQAGVAEAELEADVAGALRRIFFGLSGDAPLNKWIERKPPDAKLLDGLIDPRPFPGWMSGADLGIYLEAFRAGGFHGPLNRYRAEEIDFNDLAQLRGRSIMQPSTFVAGERDAVRAFIPELDLYADPGIACADFRGSTIVPGVGHWVQQEAPTQTNEALEAFVRAL